MNTFALLLTTFLASAVEAVEALTIVLAAGVTRGWRSALIGMAAAAALLALLIVALGPALSHIPIDALRAIVGALLLSFGLQWSRKAILRASGYKAQHDEAEIFARQTSAARSAAAHNRAGLDWYGFTLAFKGVVLEGLEVIFIVLSFGESTHRLVTASAGAAAAVVLTIMVGIMIRKPLERAPENMTKLVVGLMLTTFGTFWGGEGAGIKWPGSDASILGLLALYAVTMTVTIGVLRAAQARAASLKAAAS